MFEELEDLQTHMYEHDDEVEESSKNTRATMVQKTSGKEPDGRLASTDETMESEESEEEDDEDESIDDENCRNEEDDQSVLSTEIVTVSTS